MFLTVWFLSLFMCLFHKSDHCRADICTCMLEEIHFYNTACRYLKVNYSSSAVWIGWRSFYMYSKKTWCNVFAGLLFKGLLIQSILLIILYRSILLHCVYIWYIHLLLPCSHTAVHSTSRNKNNKRTHTSELDFKSEKHVNISEKVQQFLTQF
jgi:hypothetical protein